MSAACIADIHTAKSDIGPSRYVGMRPIQHDITVLPRAVAGDFDILHQHAFDLKPSPRPWQGRK